MIAGTRRHCGIGGHDAVSAVAVRGSAGVAAGAQKLEGLLFGEELDGLEGGAFAALLVTERALGALPAAAPQVRLLRIQIVSRARRVHRDPGNDLGEKALVAAGIGRCFCWLFNHRWVFRGHL